MRILRSNADPRIRTFPVSAPTSRTLACEGGGSGECSFTHTRSPKGPQPWVGRLPGSLHVQTRDAGGLTRPPPPAGTGMVGVLAPSQVRGFRGDTVKLPCIPQPEQNVQGTQGTWTRAEPAGDPRSVAIFHPPQGASFSEPGRLEFAATSLGQELLDAWLVVRRRRGEDQANYTCQSATLRRAAGAPGPGPACSARGRGADLGSELGHPVPSVSPPPLRLRCLLNDFRLEVTRPLFSSCQLRLEPVPGARCISSRGRPPAQIPWSSHLGGKANNSQEPGAPAWLVCHYQPLHLNSPKPGRRPSEPTCLFPPEPPEVSISGYNDHWYLGRREAGLNCDVCGSCPRSRGVHALSHLTNPEHGIQRSLPVFYHANATAVAALDYPPLSMSPLPPSAVAQGTLFLIHTVDEAINTTFIALGTGQAELTVLVRGEEPPEWGDQRD
ncbi:LOW QUALITY PROTEIN: poliovirus receptor-like [Manis pentadactyla]|uniref:LOW QUALITY PROTEIN: poliovirus receptor-like n=1 Tax=Manis pentadactyla TaxID=143292 RepID=UPI00255C6AE9|nr:LOW QUALITY PROTEIN: poliovirus receptor-like [Manis pentadactyla]